MGLLFIALAGCGVAPGGGGTGGGGGAVMVPACPDAGTTLTYADFGAAFMTRYCVDCHGGRRVERGVDLTTVGGVRANSTEIYGAAVDTSRMPQQQPTPTGAERMQLGLWLSCGAP